MARARTGTLEGPIRDAAGRAYYRGKVRLQDGTRMRVDIPEPKCRSKTAARNHIAFAQEHEDATHAIYQGRVAGRADTDAITVGTEGESVASWFGRYYEWREERGRARGRGAESVSDSRGRFRKWIEPKIGLLAMKSVTRDVLEGLVSYLDDVVEEEKIAPKTATNVWGECTAGFGVATRCKDKALRVLTVNPTTDMEGPDDGVSKRKPFLRPEEITKLLSCEAVPIERRYAYAVAIYTAMRQGELRGLRVGDVDFDAMQITVARTLKNGKEKSRTKNGRARVIQIEPNLVPLLRTLADGKKPADRLLSIGAHNRCASNLREDLVTARCTREALHVPKADKLRAHIKFHNLKDTCGTHMAVRRDPPQDIQWRLAHSDAKTAELYIANARYEAGANFGTPLGPLPPSLIGPPARTTHGGETPGRVLARPEDGEPPAPPPAIPRTNASSDVFDSRRRHYHFQHLAYLRRLTRTIQTPPRASISVTSTARRTFPRCSTRPRRRLQTERSTGLAPRR